MPREVPEGFSAGERQGLILGCNNRSGCYADGIQQADTHRCRQVTVGAESQTIVVSLFFLCCFGQSEPPPAAPRQRSLRWWEMGQERQGQVTQGHRVTRSDHTRDRWSDHTRP